MNKMVFISSNELKKENLFDNACTPINLLSFIIEIIAFQKETEQIVFAS